MLLQPRQLAPQVPFTTPPVSYLTLQDYLTSLVNQYGGVYWPLDDVTNNPYNRVINAAVAKGRQLALTPDFATDTNWAKSAGCTISGGVGVFTAVTGGSGFLQAVCQLGKVYEITFDLVVTSGTMNARAGSTGTGATRSVSGTYTDTVVCSGSTSVGFVAVTTFTGTIDNVSVKELNIPAYNAVPAQLLNTDVWNNLGTAAWTVINAAVLTAPTTTRHDGLSGTVLRITRGNTAVPGASQFVFSIGVAYRVYGWCRSDGVTTPRVLIDAAARFTGTPSTDWQPYDFVYVPTTASVLRYDLTTTSAPGQWAEYDVTVVALDTGMRTDSPGVDLNMENSGRGAWVDNVIGTVTKDTSAPHSGTQNIRVARSTNNNPSVQQLNLCIGKTYLVTGWFKGDGSAVPSCAFGGTTITGTSSATWQSFSRVVAVTATSVRLQATTSTGTQFAEFDDITITELSPLVALPVNGAVLGNSEAPLRIGTSVSFDGVNDLINLYSAQLNSISPVDEATLILFVKVSGPGIWTNGVAARLISYRVDANNTITIDKTGANNTLLVSYIAGGTTVSVTIGSQSSTGWLQVAITLSKSGNAMKAFINGSQVGSTQTGQGTWVGNLVSTTVTLGAGNTGASSPFSGFEAHLILLPVALAIDYISEISKLGDAS